MIAVAELHRQRIVREIALSQDDPHFPRDEHNRYRIYRVRKGVREVMCTTSTAQGIGVALVTLADEGEYDSDDAVGVLDTHGRDDVPGTWIVNPYATGR